MTRLAGLFVIVGGLACVVALEVIDRPHGDVAPLRSREADTTSPAATVTNDHTSDWVTTVLARPLFSPDRRPAPAAANVNGGTARGLPRLTGILVGPFGRSAIFAADSAAKPIVVQEGGHVAAYTVRSIEAAQVQLSGPNGAQVLHPSFDAAPASPTVSPTASPTSPPPPRRVGQAPAPAAR
jgi:hypothetical protein